MIRMRGTLRAIALLAVGMAACGPKPRPVTGGDGTGSVASTTGVTPAVFQSGAAVTPESVCARIFELKDARCELVTGYELTETECQADFRRSFEERGPEAAKATAAAGRCLLDNGSCEAVGECIANLNEYADEQDGSPSEFRECADTGKYAPIGRPKAEWDKRRGAGAKTFGEVATTKEQPIEVCGIPAEMEWLLSVTCSDGSRPFRGWDHAHAARVGNVGPGGACGSIVDLYEVPCPEGTHAIYMDAYVCPLPE